MKNNLNETTHLTEVLNLERAPCLLQIVQGRLYKNDLKLDLEGGVGICEVERRGRTFKVKRIEPKGDRKVQDTFVEYCFLLNHRECAHELRGLERLITRVTSQKGVRLKGQLELVWRRL